MRSTRGECALVVSLLILCAVGCSDDSSEDLPGGEWQEVALENAPDPGILMGIAFSGSTAWAVGAGTEGAPPSVRYTPFVAAPSTVDSWRRVTGSWLPAEGLLTTVGFAAGGQAIIAGAALNSPGGGFVLDERDGWNRIPVPLGALATAVSAGEIRLAGSSTNNAQLLASIAADAWNPESLPFPSGTGERGLADIFARNGVWVACGFDDGAEGTPESPNGVVFRRSGGAWERLPSPCGGCGNREFRAVAISATGGILLGGAITDFSLAAPDDYVAFLLVRSPSGDWAEIVLPQAGALDRINDIWIAADRSLYLACGQNGTARILHLPVGKPAALEATLSNARIEELAEGPDGAIYAAGVRLDPGDPGLSSPAIWRRSPAD